jgi:fatty acid desaturase
MEMSQNNELNQDLLDHKRVLDRSMSRSIPSKSDDINGYEIDRKSLQKHIRRLSQVNDFKGLLSIANQWLVIIGSIAIALGIFHYFAEDFNLLHSFPKLAVKEKIVVFFVYLVSVIVISTRQHALGIIVHDATHYLILKNRLWNDIITDLTCAFPINFSTSLYRSEHLDHHRFTNTSKDPYWATMMADKDWLWPKTQKECASLFTKDILGLNLPKWSKIISPWTPWTKLFNFDRENNIFTNREKLLFGFFWLSLISFLLFTHSLLYFLLFWQLPQLTIVNTFVRLRSVAEHLVLDNKNELRKTRHVNGNAIENFALAPLNINYHLAHHLFPSIPQYNLPELHRILMKDINYRSHAKITPTYLGIKNGLLSEILIS